MSYLEKKESMINNTKPSICLAYYYFISFTLFLLYKYLICFISRFVIINPIIIIDTPTHCNVESFSNKTILAVSNPVMGTNNDKGEILLSGYLDIKILQNPYPNSVEAKAKYKIANMDIMFKLVMELIRVCGESINRANNKAGIGVTKLPHTTKLIISSSSLFSLAFFDAVLATIFEKDQNIGAHIVSKIAPRGIELIPLVVESMPITRRPKAPIIKPTNCLVLKLSFNNKYPKNGDIKACNCTIIEANPAGIPICIA